MKERNFENDVNIDINALEQEWEKQASTFMYWAVKEAEALEAKDKAIQQLEIVQAKLDAKIRTSPPNKYGLDKFTEAAIKNIISTDKDCLEIENEIIEKTKAARIFGAAVKAMDHKNKALTKLSDLWLGGYWSSGGAPREMKESINKRKTDEQREALNKRLKK